LHVEFRT